MLVDTLLKYYGRNPEVYSENGDKWIRVFSEFLLSAYIYFPIVFALLPWAYFFWKKEQHKKDRGKFTKNIVIASIVGLVLGLMAPYIILAIAAGLAARSLYGG